MDAFRSHATRSRSTFGMAAQGRFRTISGEEHLEKSRDEGENGETQPVSSRRLLKNPMGSPLILGLDPGTSVVGYGFVQKKDRTCQGLDHGEIDVSDREKPDHLVEIYSEVQDLIDTYAPAVVSIEEAFYGPNAKASMKLGEARGTLLLAARQAEAEIREYTPTQIKKAVTGNGNATKKQVSEMILAMMNLPDNSISNHVSDALAAGICYVHRT